MAEIPTYSVLDAWLSDPHPAGTVMLANWLAGVGHGPWPEPHVDRAGLIEFGRRAAAAHAAKPAVLLALGRMFLAWRELSAALTTLVRAATLAPHEPLTFRLLGEVLFRRGDPVRAARVLDRAMAGGMTDADTRAWHAAARAYSTEPDPATRMPSAAPPPFAAALLARSERPPALTEAERAQTWSALQAIAGPGASGYPPPYSWRPPEPEPPEAPGELVDPKSFHDDVG